MNSDKMITFDMYRNRNAVSQTSKYNPASVDEILRFWKANKNLYLTKIFDKELILSKQIVYEQSRRDLEESAKALLDEYRNFINLYDQKVQEAFHFPSAYPVWSRPDEVSEENYWCYYDTRTLINANTLIDNRITNLHKDCFVITLNGQNIALQNGMKTMRALSKICAALGITSEFDEFRLAQSLMTNQKRVTGTLHLSIHPMDYATASDNANGWSSCMSWEDEGCYRLGTVEMMNSPMVVCAYLASDKVKFQFGFNKGGEWNSKKWRAWLIIHPQFIFVNRHYPYHSDSIATSILEWAKELVAEKLGWHYGPIINNFVSYWNEQSENNPNWKNSVIISTNYMYNDIGGDDILGCMSTTNNPDVNPNFKYEINISGPAECMYCGSEIKASSNVDAGTLLCPECNNPICDCCGRFIDEEVYTDPEGNSMCGDCYTENYTQCHACGDIISYQQISTVIAPHHKAPKYAWMDKSATTMLCPACVEQYLDRGWIIDVNESYKFEFSTPELTARWQEGIEDAGYAPSRHYVHDVYTLNPDPHIAYDRTYLLDIFGYHTEPDYCSTEQHWSDITRGKMDITIWQKNLVSPLYNTEEEDD